MKSIRGKTKAASRILSKTARVYAVTIVLLILISKEVVYRSVYADMEKMAKETMSLKLDSTARLLNNMLDDANRCFQTAVGTSFYIGIQRYFIWRRERGKGCQGTEIFK